MLPPGTNIGQRYIIERLLGQGGMSNLYIATDLRQGKAVRVIKEMTARYADPGEQKMAEQLFMREAQLLATLNHPHIPKVFDKFIFQGKYYLSMEYVQGEDLGKLIQDRGKIEEKWVAAWGSQMATVLYYLHRQNPPIVFRDVKPSNIMIVNNEVKLIDFGIARHFTNSKKGDTMRIGSPGYAPPEQYGGQTDPRSDIYALGVTMHHAATGYDPTISQTPFVIPPARNLNPQLSTELEAILVRATQLDPDKRYQNCLDMKRDLQNVMRMHGMVVGTSVPFSTLNQPATPAPTAASAATAAPAATAASAASATVPNLPPPSAGGAAAPTAGATIPNPVVPQSAAGVPPQPAGQPGQQPPAAPPTVRKRGLPWAALFLLATLGAGGIAAFKAPPEWRTRATEQVQQWLAQLPQPAVAPSPLSDGERVLLRGGSAAEACEALGAEVRAGKATPRQQVLYQNALAYASGRPLRRLVLVAAEQEKLWETVAFWQRLSWEVPNQDGALTVVAVEAVKEDWRQALRRSRSDQLFREGARAEALVVMPPETRPPGWKDWFQDSPPLYWVGPRVSGDPEKVKTLEFPPAQVGEVVDSLELGSILWLSKKFPASSKSTTKDYQGVETLVKLVKENAKAWLVVDSEQLESIDPATPLQGLKVLVLAPGGSLPSGPLPVGQLMALTQATAFSSDPSVAAFQQNREGLHAPLFDSLGWAASQLNQGGREQGLSWRSQRSGEVLSARWQLMEARQGGWHWVREVGARP